MNLNNLFKLLMLGKLLRGRGGFGGGRSPQRRSGGMSMVMIIIVAGIIFWQYSQKQKATRPTRESDSRQTDSRTAQDDRPTRTNPPAVQINPGRLDPVKPDAPVENGGSGTSVPLERDRSSPTITGDGGIGKLYREGKSNVIVTTGGTIAKVLPDDNETADGSSRHQRFLVRLVTGDTILIAHNIDLTERIPAKEGDVIKFKGEYEWTEKGGVVHWTHHDPRNRHEDGWIEHAGKRYE